MWIHAFVWTLLGAGINGPEAAVADLAPAVKIEAAGEPIDVEVGHAAPFYADIDGDGLKDLLVGQFGGGELRIYKNIGARDEPQFDNYSIFEADGKEASVPYG